MQQSDSKLLIVQLVRLTDRKLKFATQMLLLPLSRKTGSLTEDVWASKKRSPSDSWPFQMTTRLSLDASAHQLRFQRVLKGHRVDESKSLRPCRLNHLPYPPPDSGSQVSSTYMLPEGSYNEVMKASPQTSLCGTTRTSLGRVTGVSLSLQTKWCRLKNKDGLKTHARRYAYARRWSEA